MVKLMTLSLRSLGIVGCMEGQPGTLARERTGTDGGAWCATLLFRQQEELFVGIVVEAKMGMTMNESVVMS